MLCAVVFVAPLSPAVLPRTSPWEASVLRVVLPPFLGSTTPHPLPQRHGAQRLVDTHALDALLFPPEVQGQRFGKAATWVTLCGGQCSWARGGRWR